MRNISSGDTTSFQKLDFDAVHAKKIT
jgi:hypothetical protein